MINRRLLFVLVFVVLATFGTSAFAAKGTPLTATFSTNLISTATGVFDDGNPVYENGIGGVQCYFSANGQNVDLVTYNTSRTLLFDFDSTSPALQLSGLPSSFHATVDLYGVNYFGPYSSMGVGTTAQVNAALQFYVGRVTYQLAYQSLAVMRLSASTWLVTSSPNDIPGYPGFTASDQAALSVIRRKSQQTFGAVNMPIRFEVNLN